MSRRNNRLRKKLVLAFFLLLLPVCLVAAPPQITDIQPPNAVGGQQIRIIGTGFPEPHGYAASTRVFLRQGEYSASENTVGTTTEIWVTLPSGLVAGEVSIKVSNLANTSQPFTYTVGSTHVPPTARSCFPASPYPGQRTFVAVDAFTPQSYGSGTGSGTIFEIRQGEALFSAQIEPVAADPVAERTTRLDKRGTGLRPGEPEKEELISTITPGYAMAGGIMALPSGLVAGPATIRAGHQSDSVTVWGPDLPFTVASIPTPLTLIDTFRDSVAPGQYLFVLTGSPLESGVVGDPASGSRVLEFTQGPLTYERAADLDGPYVSGIVPEGLSPGSASVRVKTSFSGTGVSVYSNTLDLTVSDSPLRPTLGGGSSIGPGGGAAWLYGWWYLPTEMVPLPTGAGKNLVRIRQGSAVFEVAPSSVGTDWLDFPRPPGLVPGVAEVSVVSTYGSVAAEESNRAAVEVIANAPVLTSISSAAALSQQHVWAFGSGFSRYSNRLKFYQGEDYFASSYADVNEPGAASFTVPGWLDPGSYQVAVENDAGETARLTFEVGSTAAPIQILSCPANVGAGERFLCRAAGTNWNTTVEVRQGDVQVGTAWLWEPGVIFVILDDAPAGPAALVFSTPLGGPAPVVTTHPFTVSLSPDPPVLTASFRYGIPIAATGQRIGLEISGVSVSGMSAEITQGTGVFSIPNVSAGDNVVWVTLPDGLGPGAAEVRVKGLHNGVETGWSNSVPVWVSDLPSITPNVDVPFRNVPGKTTDVGLGFLSPGAQLEVAFSGEAGTWVIDEFFDENLYNYRLFPFPSDIPPGIYLCKARVRPAGGTVFSPWTTSIAVEVTPGAVGNGDLAMGLNDLIYVPFRAGFTFPFSGRTAEGLWVTTDGEVYLGDYAQVGWLFPLNSNLDPRWDGSIRFEPQTSWFDVVYDQVPEFGQPANRSTVRLRLFPDGRFDFIYGDVQLTNSWMQVGFFCPEAGADQYVDFSTLDLSRPIGTGTETGIWEQMPADEFDLDHLTLHFAANGRQATGYTILGTDGGIFAFGGAQFYGSLPAIGLIPDAPLSNLTHTGTEQGYYMMGLDGGVFCFGDAQFLGSLPGLGINNQTIDLEAVPGGQGYYLLGPDGGVFAFGTAEFHGSLPGVGVVNTALDMEITPSGQGYWILGIDGGIFAFGDAQFYGSLPQLGVVPVAPLKRIKSTPDGRGYYLLGQDGGVFAFGNASFWGSLPSVGVANQAVDLEITPNNQGYYMLGVDGGIFSFGDAGFFNSLPGIGIATTTLDMEVKTNR